MIYTVKILTAERNQNEPRTPEITRFEYQYKTLQAARQRYNSVLRGMLDRMTQSGHIYKFKMIIADDKGVIYRKAVIDNAV